MTVRAGFKTCPVCKASIDEGKVIPIYGRGSDGTDPRKSDGGGGRAAAAAAAAAAAQSNGGEGGENAAAAAAAAVPAATAPPAAPIPIPTPASPPPLLPGVLDPITMEPVRDPTVCPHGHVMGFTTWAAVLAEGGGVCPFTRERVGPGALTRLTEANIGRWRDRLITMDA